MGGISNHQWVTDIAHSTCPIITTYISIVWQLSFHSHLGDHHHPVFGVAAILGLDDRIVDRLPEVVVVE